MEKSTHIHFASPNELHLWLLPIPEVPPAYFPEGYALLTPAELKRNQRYLFEKDRIRHLLTRVFIRQLLGAYLEEDPKGLQFQSNQYGRPALIWPDEKPRLDFNLSHAGEMIACGVVPNGRIGIDIEPIDRDVQTNLASSFFSQIEIKELFSLPQEAQAEHFLRLWTLKEAYIKARGAGMSISLDSFGFYDFTGGGFQFWDQNEQADTGKQWSFFSLRPVLGHRLAGAWQYPSVQEQEILLRVKKFLPSQPYHFENLSFSIAGWADIDRKL